MESDHTLRGEFAPPLGGDLDSIEHARLIRALEDELIAEGAVLDRIGRYRVRGCLGEGGQGIVYSAYDPQLERPIAIKVLHPGGHKQAEQRLLREAKSLAALWHPNVVGVLDAGIHLGQVFVAMEFVAGTTLRQWLAQAPRSWRAIVEQFMAAGRGLAAAHQEGLVHRDFKPDNVLVSESGRVCVSDFGLARGYTESSTVDIEPQDAGWFTGTDRGMACDTVVSDQPTVENGVGAERDASSEGGPPTPGHCETLTQPDTVVGTPAYMAPEQFTGKKPGASADQFSFCVALWEALYGERPFVGSTMSELLYAVSNGRIETPPRGRKVPAWLRRACERGLASGPEARWPSMDALLVELARGQDRVRRRSLAAIGGVALAVIVGTFGLFWSESGAQLCRGATKHLADVWNDERRQDVEAALIGTKVSYAPGVWNSVEATLDAYAAQWVEAHIQACEATNVHREQSVAMMDLRMGCLRRAKADLWATVDVLRTADAAVVEKANNLVHGLPKLERCADVEALEPEGDGSAHIEAAPEVEAIRAELSAVQALERAGKYQDAYERLQPLDERAASLGHPPLQAELRYAQGSVLEKLGHYQQAADQLRAALSVALEHGPTRVAVAAATASTFVYGQRLQVFERAAATADMALALARKLQDAELEANVRNSMGAMLYRQGKYKEAEEEHRKALAIRQRVLGPDHPDVAYSHNNLGTVLYGLGDYKGAEEAYRRAFAIRHDTLGPDHPDVAASHDNLGLALYAQGNYKGFEAEQLEALAIRRKALGDDHPDVAASHNNLGGALYSQGRHKEAEEHHRMALAIDRKTLGDDHPDVAMSRNNLGNALFQQGKYKEAEAEWLHALVIKQRALGPDHPDVAYSHNNLGTAYDSQGKYKEAEEQHRKALAIRRKTLGDDHPDVAYSHHNLADSLSDQARSAEALAHFERAWTIRERTEGPPELRAMTAFALARLLWKLKKQRPRALELANEAHGAYRQAGDQHAAAREQVEEWLRKHRPIG